jgi:hypothetical protein
LENIAIMNEPAGAFEMFWKHLQQSEYLHVLLNPLPVYGLAVSVVALAVAAFLRNRSAQIAALLIVLLSAGSAWPVVEFGEKSFDQAQAMSDDAGYRWLDAHAQRATRLKWIFYLTAAVAALALALPWKFPKTAMPLVITTLIFSLIAIGCGGWIALAGGQVRHKEFRAGLPPEPEGGYQKMRD